MDKYLQKEFIYVIRLFLVIFLVGLAGPHLQICLVERILAFERMQSYSKCSMLCFITTLLSAPKDTRPWNFRQENIKRSVRMQRV